MPSLPDRTPCLSNHSLSLCRIEPGRHNMLSCLPPCWRSKWSRHSRMPSLPDRTPCLCRIGCWSNHLPHLSLCRIELLEEQVVEAQSDAESAGSYTLFVPHWVLVQPLAGRHNILSCLPHCRRSKWLRRKWMPKLPDCTPCFRRIRQCPKCSLCCIDSRWHNRKPRLLNCTSCLYRIRCCPNHSLCCIEPGRHNMLSCHPQCWRSKWSRHVPHWVLVQPLTPIVAVPH